MGLALTCEEVDEAVDVAITDITTRVARPPGRAGGATDTAPGAYRCCHAIAAGMMPKRERMPKAPGQGEGLGCG